VDLTRIVRMVSRTGLRDPREACSPLGDAEGVPPSKICYDEEDVGRCPSWSAEGADTCVPGRTSDVSSKEHRFFMTSLPNEPILEYLPVTRERLPDLARFSAHHGKFRYCSCMRWRLPSSEYQRATKDQRVAALEGLICQGTPVGVLAYQDGEPIGWCSIAPRETYRALERYRALPRLDAAPVWSVACFFVDRFARGCGITLGLLRAAVEYARSQGATVIEGYPVEPGSHLYTYMGSPETFRQAGFSDVTPLGQVRLVMRLTVSTEQKSESP
jgi:GNAT superfamily N-acetyltransferase